MGIEGDLVIVYTVVYTHSGLYTLSEFSGGYSLTATAIVASHALHYNCNLYQYMEPWLQL